MSETLYRIKPLEWRDCKTQSGLIAFASGFTAYIVYQCGNEITWRDQCRVKEHKAKTVNAAKRAAEKDWQKRIRYVLEEVYP